MTDLDKYLALPYAVVLRRDEDGDFVARVEELEGCAAHGKTELEALEQLNHVKKLWIADCLENGDPLPEPFVEDDLPSGKWVQRVPRTLHRKIQNLAAKERVSLNQCVTAILAEAVGEKQPRLANTDALDLPEVLDALYDGITSWLVVNQPKNSSHIDRLDLVDTIECLRGGQVRKSVGKLIEAKNVDKKDKTFGFECHI